MRDTFSEYHPAVGFTFFGAVILFSMFCLNPVMLALSVLSGGAYRLFLRRAGGTRTPVGFLIPVVLLALLVNTAFNHQGMTILLYVNDNPITLESIAYGAASGAMLAAIILWFSCYNAVMTSDKFLYLFGRFIPALSLVFSMALRFVPRFRTQVGRISAAQRGIGQSASDGGFFVRIRHSLTILTALLAWSFENAAETADSMKSRGYGLPGRTAYSNYRFERRDGLLLAGILLLTAVTAAALASGVVKTGYFPLYTGIPHGAAAILYYVCYGLLLNIPLAAGLTEEMKWNYFRSKT